MQQVAETADQAIEEASRHLCDSDSEESSVGDPSVLRPLFHNVQFSRVTSIQVLAYNPAIPTRSQLNVTTLAPHEQVFF